MKKRIVTIALVVALLATCFAGTYAYLMDDEQVTNTMVVGNVDIEIDEFQKNEDGVWETFVNDDFTLFPLENAQGVQLRNKIAYTANTSTTKNDAYIRTIVLFEANDLLTDEYKDQADCCVPGLHFNYFDAAEATSVANGKTIHGAKTTNLNIKVTINGNEYWVVLFEEVSGLAVPYDEALFSLNGVFMDKNITQELAKGWGEDGVDIIVFSQGIQAEGLTYEQAMAELGEINETNLQSWIDGEDAVVNDWN